MHKFAAKLGKRIDTIPPDVMAALQAHLWPGNIRELENVIERAMILTLDTTLRLDDALATRRRAEAQPSDSLTLAAVDRQHMLWVLQETQWTIEGKGGAAVHLGLHPSTVRSRMRLLGINRSRTHE